MTSHLPDMANSHLDDAERRLLATQTALFSDVARALAGHASVSAVLQECVEALVRHLDVAFARIWVLNDQTQILELLASAGTYTHLDGPHSRVPMGSLKIGRIAAERRPHLTNFVMNDPHVSDHDWAQRENMVAFAGYPLLIEDRVVGVMGMFSRHSLAQYTLDHLAAIALTIATGIDRKQVEEALQEERETLETINRVGTLVTAELDLDKLVQAVTDAATQLVGATMGAFFYNVLTEQGESYTLYTLSGVPREAFARFPMPRNTGIFGPTFRGEAVVRLDDVRLDSHYGHNPPYFGIPEDHPPVASHLAVPVISRSGEVLGGLFFGHPGAGVFTNRAEQIAVGLAAHAAVAIDNARLFQQAQDATRVRDNFLLSVSHDLKTPLTAIYGQAQLIHRRLARNPENVAQLTAGLGVIEERIRGMTSLLDELVDVARLHVGQRLELNREATNLSTLVDQAVGVLGQTAKQCLHIEQADLGLDGLWDAPRVTRVLDNILGNAAKYSPEGSTITVAVTRQVDAAGTWAVLSVRDEGVGIPVQDLPHIFERFYRASNVPHAVTGSGLGLTGVREIVEQHGGSIEIESSERSGTTVTVRLPLHTGEGMSSVV